MEQKQKPSSSKKGLIFGLVIIVIGFIVFLMLKTDDNETVTVKPATDTEKTPDVESSPEIVDETTDVETEDTLTTQEDSEEIARQKALEAKLRAERLAKAANLYAKGNALYNDGGKEEALKILKEAADLGNTEAQLMMGTMYLNGSGGVEQDVNLAIQWLLDAARAGDVEAQRTLGFVYSSGFGVAKNFKESFKWYRKAAEQGNSFSQCELGNAYTYGYGVKKNLGQAAKWYLKSAEQGEISAQYLVAQAYENGTGIAQSTEEAKKWYQKAAAQGYQNAITALNRMGN